MFDQLFGWSEWDGEQYYDVVPKVDMSILGLKKGELAGTMVFDEQEGTLSFWRNDETSPYLTLTVTPGLSLKQ